MNKNSETNNSKKYYALFETDEDGIRQFRNASPEDKKGVTLSTMRVEGKKVPAFKIEVDKPTYDHFKRDQWMQEYHYKMDNRCTICGQNGKSRICPINVPNPDYVEGGTAPKTIANDCSNCPYNRIFKTFKGKVLFSTLTLSDEQGNEDAFEPEDTTHSITSSDDYDHLLKGFINYVKEHGYDPVYGARPLKRFLQKHVETLAARLILSDQVQMGDTILIDCEQDNLTAKVK